MLRVRVGGGDHPKPLFILTDDSDGELARMEEICQEAGLGVEDDIVKALGDSEKVVPGLIGYGTLEPEDVDLHLIKIPGGEVADAADLFGAEWDAVYEAVEKLREEALAAMEAAAEEAGE